MRIQWIAFVLIANLTSTCRWNLGIYRQCFVSALQTWFSLATFWGTPSVTDDFTGEFDTIIGRQTLTFYLMYLRHRNDNSRLEIGPRSKLVRKSQSRSCNTTISTRTYPAKLSRISSEENIIVDISRVFNWWPLFRLIRLTLLPNPWESMVLVLKILSYEFTKGGCNELNRND